jgi:gamma-glutamyl:cysteine ligase YbdK (ATP-grasp superfamily)
MLHAFEACGLELEYALVRRDSLDVAPIGDRILQQLSGSAEAVSDWEHDGLGWSNELVLHVLELKNVRPTSDLPDLTRRFQNEVVAMNRALQSESVRLMPGGMHPWMDPKAEAQLWPHAHSEVYRAYDRIFGARSHGWANVQSTQLNLPFANDEEFARLHAALRPIAAILPALAAASPYADGRAPGPLDYRMEVYRGNADAVPQVNGDLMPNVVTTRADYERRVLRPIYDAIRPHDPKGILQHEWLNARGVIARFDRNALEIRVLDAQECPAVDVAIAAFVCDLAQSLYERQFVRPAVETQLPNRTLSEIFLKCVHEADRAQIDSPEFLQLFGVARRECRAGVLWENIAERLERESSTHARVWRSTMEFVLTRGPLSRRLLRAVGPRPDRAALHELYAALCDALEAGKPFDP